MADCVPRGLRFEVIAPPVVAAGDPVPITLRLTNTGARQRELYLLGRETVFDVAISRPGGTLVWRRLAGATVPMILQLRTLRPGETFELSTGWDQRATDGRRVAAGTYIVRGELPGDTPRPLRTAAVRLRIDGP